MVMKRLSKTLPIWMALLVLVACDKEVAPEPFHYDREVIAIFPPEGIETHTLSGLVYQGLYRAAKEQKGPMSYVLPPYFLFLMNARMEEIKRSSIRAT